MLNYLTEDQEDTLRDASKLWGKSFQKKIATEECSELILAMCHFDRGRIEVEDLLEEVADVMIICRQIVLDHEDDFRHPSIAQYVQQVIDEKMERLEKRVKADSPNWREVV